MRLLTAPLIRATVLVGGFACSGNTLGPDVTVALDANVRHQTILGWGATASRLHVPDFLRDQVLDKGRCVASKLTVAGDYVFRFEVKDREHAVSKDLTVTVHPKWPKNGVRESKP